MANNIIACDPVTCYSRTEIVDAEPTMTSLWISLEPNSLIEFREEQSGDASSFSKIQRARFLDLVRKFEFHRRNSVTNVRGVATNFVNRLRDIVEWKGLVLKPNGWGKFHLQLEFPIAEMLWNTYCFCPIHNSREDFMESTVLTRRLTDEYFASVKSTIHQDDKQSETRFHVDSSWRGRDRLINSLIFLLRWIFSNYSRWFTNKKRAPPLLFIDPSIEEQLRRA